eukprot:gene7894-8748_t
MKFLVALLCVAAAAASLENVPFSPYRPSVSYSLTGGYKEEGKYTYRYEAFVNPAQIPDLERQFTKLHFIGTVEFHFMRNTEVVMIVKELNIFECYSDPKNSSRMHEKRSKSTEQIALKYLTKPIVFEYTYGLVQRVFALNDDPDWSVNTKKGILNMIHVDVDGKDHETGLKDMFTEEEATIFGICEATYTTKNYEVVDARQIRQPIGLNITKSIDYEKCTSLSHDVFNKVVQGKNTDQESNPLKVSATIKHNIIGAGKKFKIEAVSARGLYVLYPFSKDEGGIPSETIQILTLIKEEGSLFEKHHPHILDNLVQRGRLIMSLPSIHKPDIFPALTTADRERKSIHINDTITRFVSLIPEETPVQSVTLVPELSVAFLEIVNSLRDCDADLLSRVWQKCCDQSTRKWLVYALSSAQTESSVNFVHQKISNISDESILNFLQGIGFTGKPTRIIVTKLRQICLTPSIADKPLLSQACWISASNVAKGFCKINRICSSWVEAEIRKALLQILTTSLTKPETWEPIKHLSTHTVLAIAENLGRPSFLTALEKIILSPVMPTSIKMHAISACRPLMHIAPRRVQLLLLRVFRDFQYDSESRTLAFSVLMEQPDYRIVQIIAREILVEPSLNVRKFVYETLTEMSKSDLTYNRAIRNVCKTVLKMYPELYLPSDMTTSRSRHWAIRHASSRYGVLVELDDQAIANNRSSIPRFEHLKLRAIVLGRKLEVLDTQMYMQGFQDYINWMMSLVSLHTTLEESSNQELLNVQRKIAEINQKTMQRNKEPENLKFEAKVKVFDKLVSIQELNLKKTTSFMDYLIVRLPEIMRVATKLAEGKTWTWFKPIMPVEVIYTVPSLVGIPLDYNMTSVIMPYVKSSWKVDMKPDPISPSFWMLKKKLQSLKVTGSKNVNSLTEVRGKIAFRLPFLEVGAETRKILNTSVHCSGMISYDFTTAEFNHQYKIPQNVQEVLLTRTESAHYIKTTGEPIKTIDLTPDQLGKIEIINVTGPCVGQCRSEEWILKATNGTYLNVKGNKIALSAQPLKFKVIFHGVNRRIISLYVAEKGFVVLSKTSANLFLKNNSTRSGKLFIVDFDENQQTVIKSLVQLDVTPSDWGLPNVAEVEEMRRIEELIMKEMVVLNEEKYLEGGEPDPTRAQIRLTYLSVAVDGLVRLSPKRNASLKITVDRKTSLKKLLRRYSYGNRSCIGKPWGINLCVHGFVPEEMSRTPLSVLYAPLEYRITGRQDKDIQTRIIRTLGRLETNSTGLLKYVVQTDLLGTSQNKSLKTEIFWDKQEYKIKMNILPSHFDLLNLKKICYSEQYKPDNYSLKISVHPECKINQIEADLLAPKQFPRHQLAFRFHFTNQELPLCWRRVLSALGRNVVVPLLRLSSDFQITKRQYYQKSIVELLERTDVPNKGTMYVRYFLTRNDTVTLKIESPSETWVWENLKLNTYMRSFPIGSRYMPVVAQMYWGTGKAVCQHRNSTFVTLDKVVFNYSLKRQCDHVLMRSCYKNMTQFLVLTRKMQGPKNQLKRVVSTIIGDYQIEIVPGENYTSKPNVLINSKPVTFGEKYEITKNAEPLIYIVWEPQLHSIALYHVETGLFVNLRKSFKVTTSISQLYFSKVCGLCGDFNGETSNEFLTPERQIIHDVQKPKIYDPELKSYEHQLFGNSWLVPGAKCNQLGCKFVRENAKIKAVEHDKLCLTAIKVPQCMQKCKPIQTERMKVPVTCVAEKELPQLKEQLRIGQPVTLSTATQRLVTVEVPTECNCTCEVRPTPPKKEEKKDCKDDYWSKLYHIFFGQY